MDTDEHSLRGRNRARWGFAVFTRTTNPRQREILGGVSVGIQRQGDALAGVATIPEAEFESRRTRSAKARAHSSQPRGQSRVPPRRGMAGPRQPVLGLGDDVCGWVEHHSLARNVFSGFRLVRARLRHRPRTMSYDISRLETAGVSDRGGESGCLFLRCQRQFAGGNNHSRRPFRRLLGLMQADLPGGLGEERGEEHHPSRQQHGPSAEEKSELVIGGLGKQVWHGWKILSSRQTKSP